MKTAHFLVAALLASTFIAVIKASKTPSLDSILIIASDTQGTVSSTIEHAHGWCS